MRKMNRLLKALGILGLIVSFTGCYSVFSASTGGVVVDAESTSTPKTGIANVDVYAYLEAGTRDKDFNSWKEDQKFTPAAEYYGHTTTGADGSFTISKLVWKAKKPDFGKDADYTKVYLLFYHEKYGLTKGQTIIISDSYSDTVYAELTSVRKTTVLNLNFIDVASNLNTGNALYVKVVVPQSTDKVEAEPKTYSSIITGAGSILVEYPRWYSDADKIAGKEYAPEVVISYVQSGDEITWKGCYNEDNTDKNFAFRNDAETGIVRQIKNPAYSLTFYGKSTKLNFPTIGGQYVFAGTAVDDGVEVSLKQKAEDDYSLDRGQVTTYAQNLGSTASEKHGVFGGLGSGYYWNDDDYTARYSIVYVQVKAGEITKQLLLRSDVSNYTVQLQ